MTCATPDEHVLSPLDEIGEGVTVWECVNCGGEFVEDGGTLVPVAPSALVALADEHHDLGWDGHDDGKGLFASPYWERLNG